MICSLPEWQVGYETIPSTVASAAGPFSGAARLGADHAVTCPPEPSPERRGVRHADPAENPTHTPALEQGQVVDYPAAVEQQCDPHLGHQARAEEPFLPVRSRVDPARQNRSNSLRTSTRPLASVRFSESRGSDRQPAGHAPGPLRSGPYAEKDDGREGRAIATRKPRP